MENRRSSSIGERLSRTVSSLFPSLSRHSELSGLSEDELYDSIIQDHSQEDEEFFEPAQGDSEDSSEQFFDAVSDSPEVSLQSANRKSPVSPLRSKNSASESATVSMLEMLTEKDANVDQDGDEMSLSSALQASPVQSETKSAHSPVPRSFTIATKTSPKKDSRQSFFEFLKECADGQSDSELDNVDLLSALKSEDNEDEEIDLKTALDPTSAISEAAEPMALFPASTSTLHEESSLSELRSSLGSSENVQELGNLRKTLFAPPVAEHKRKESFLKRNIPLAGFFADAHAADGDVSNDSDSMISTLTEALTLKSTELSTGNNVARLSRAASVLIPASAEVNQLQEERKLKASRRYKSVPVKVKSKTKAEFNHLYLIQELNHRPSADDAGNASKSTLSESQNDSVDASRAIFALKFSPDGNYLAAAGAEGDIRIWRLLAQVILDRNAAAAGSNDPSAHLTHLEALKVATIFEEEPVQVLHGHQGEILDLAWSANNFLLSASMDKTVRLWHYSRPECLGIFEHLDYVTSVAFHPRDPRLFVSGSLDCKLRLWSIQDKAIQSWNELPPGNFITAVAFTRTGKSVVAGTAGGIALIFETEGLRYHTQIHVRSSKSKKGKKITGIEAVPGHFGDERIIVSSNDSRIRMYSLRDKNVLYKYKGHENDTSQIKANLSTEGDYVLSGSEDCRIYIWNADGRFQKKGFFSSFQRKDHILSYECFKAHSNPVTAAVLAPASVQNLLKSVQLRPLDSLQNEGLAQGQIIVTADITGQIKVFENNSRLKEWLS